MAKENTARDNRPQPSTAVIPAGYEKRTDEVVGFWDPSLGPIHFVPQFARAFDNKTDKTKPSILIQGTSVGTNTLITKDEDFVDAKEGQTIGVWYKPGMIAIRSLRGVPVYMFQNGERDTGKPQPMILFEVLSPKTGDELIITGDYRKQSAKAPLPFPIQNTDSEPF